jgi:hypothetical protein
MALYTSKTASGKTPVPSLQSALIMALLFEFTTTGALAAGDIIDLGPIEAGVKPMDVILVSDDLDTNGAPTITMSVGILNAAKTDLAAGANDTFIAASNVGQTGGLARATNASVYLCGAAAVERRLGIKIVAGAATQAAVGKKIAVQLSATA